MLTQNQSKYLRKPTVLARVPFSSSTLERKVKGGTFPPPVKLGERTVARLASEIEEWERQAVLERDARRATSEPAEAA